ncbi:ABC transporter substrate-binding protein [Candidatus Poriferisocius sp.]|uniref:ABC transporter substrate-binding protein n=1 Tax=Candidatus Poriferisocius sp. TaxID=3101276 RepID=UPI003B5A1E93
MKPTRLGRTAVFLWCLAVLALVASACGSNDDDSTGEGVVTAPTAAAPTAPDEGDGGAQGEDASAPSAEDADREPAQAPSEGDADDADGPADQPAPAEPDTTAEPTPTPTPVVLTASYQGVTESEIVIGVAAIDPIQINEMFGIDIGIFPVDKLYQALSDDLNSRGGINGRNVITHVVSFLPIGAADSERVCTELIEDKRVFVVIGQFIEDNALCITELHGHPYVGHFGENAERQERSDGLLFATEMEQTRQRVGGVTEMIRAGDLDGYNVGLYYEAPPDKAYVEAVRPLLEEAGINVVGEYSPGAPSTDTVANEIATDSITQRMEADGIDMILNVSNVYGVIQSVQRIGWEVPIAMTNGQAADRLSVPDDQNIEDEVLARTFAVTTNKPTREEALADPGVARCLAAFQEHHPDEPLDLTSSDVVNGLTNHCRAFALTVKILEAAGGNITPETFRAAAEGLGTFDLPAMVNASLSPDKHSAGSLVRRYEYFPEARTWLPVGEPIATEAVG